MQATVRRLGSQVIKMEGCSGVQKTQCLIRLYETKSVNCAPPIAHKIRHEPPPPPTHTHTHPIECALLNKLWREVVRMRNNGKVV